MYAWSYKAARYNENNTTLNLTLKKEKKKEKKEKKEKKDKKDKKEKDGDDKKEEKVSVGDNFKILMLNLPCYSTASTRVRRSPRTVTRTRSATAVRCPVGAWPPPTSPS